MRTPGFWTDEVMPFLPIQSASGLPPVHFPGPQPGDGSDQARCRANCDSALTACVAPLAVFFPFAIPACYAAHDKCLSTCNFGTSVSF